MESARENNSIIAISNARMLLNELRSNLSQKETKRISDKLSKKEAIYNFLKEKEQEGSLTNKEKKILKNIDRYPKNISMHLKNLKKHFKKLQKYHYGLDYLFNEHNEEGYAAIMILMHFKRLESFLMSVEVIFYLKKQMKLIKNS